MLLTNNPWPGAPPGRLASDYKNKGGKAMRKHQAIIVATIIIALACFGCDGGESIKVNSPFGHSKEAQAICVNGVTYFYYGFNGGVAPLYNIDGTLVPCIEKE